MDTYIHGRGHEVLGGCHRRKLLFARIYLVRQIYFQPPVLKFESAAVYPLHVPRNLQLI